MTLGNRPVPGRPTVWMAVGHGPTALAVSGGCLDIFILIYPFSSLSPFLWETARYRLKYCLKGPLNQKTTKKNERYTKAKQILTTVTRHRMRYSTLPPDCSLF